LQYQVEGLRCAPQSDRRRALVQIFGPQVEIENGPDRRKLARAFQSRHTFQLAIAANLNVR
jgi:hypothetical protein